MKNFKDQKFVEQIYLDQPGIAEEEKRRHIERYNFAQQYLKLNWIVLDAACGSGYGSEILAKKIKKVIGVDINREAINYAKEHHSQTNIEYLIGDLNQNLNFPDENFDAIISFETLEHIKNQNFLLAEFKRTLKKGGILIISTPDRVITETGDIKTPYHFKEFTKKEFCDLLAKFFKIEGLYGQTEYRFLPRWKKFLRLAVIKLDILKLRKLIFRGSLKSVVKERFNELVYTPIQKININSPSRHWVLIAICQKL